MSRKEIFLQRLATECPELIGQTMYLCPPEMEDIECVLNSDGSLTPVKFPADKYFTANDLVSELYGGVLGKVVAGKDLFEKPGRHGGIRAIMDAKQPPRPKNWRKECHGFQIGSPTYRAWIAQSDFMKENQIIQEGDSYYRSAKCVKRASGSGGKCYECKRIYENLWSKFERLKKLLCPGIERKPEYDQLIADYHWDSDRQQFSPVLFYKERLLSTKCTGLKPTIPSRFPWEKPTYRPRCEECKKAIKTLQSSAGRRRKRLAKYSSIAAAEEKRIMMTQLQYLTPDEKTKKEQLLKNQRARVMQSTQQRAMKAEKALEKYKKKLEVSNRKLEWWRKRGPKQVARLERENKKLEKENDRLEAANAQLAKFRPEFRENEFAVINVKKRLDEETRKLKNPVCRWRDEDGQFCQHAAETCGELLNHIALVHLQPQYDEQLRNDADHREYYCKWAWCGRKAPYKLRMFLNRHVAMHSGSTGSEYKLQMLRQHCINLGRPPSGHRNGPAINDNISKSILTVAQGIVSDDSSLDGDNSEVGISDGEGVEDLAISDIMNDEDDGSSIDQDEPDSLDCDDPNLDMEVDIMEEDQDISDSEDDDILEDEEEVDKSE